MNTYNEAAGHLIYRIIEGAYVDAVKNTHGLKADKQATIKAERDWLRGKDTGGVLLQDLLAMLGQPPEKSLERLNSLIDALESIAPEHFDEQIKPYKAKTVFNKDYEVYTVLINTIYGDIL